MKHPLESLMTAAGILLMALLSSLLLPAPSLGLALAQKLVGSFILWISTSFILCCFVYGFFCSARWNIMLFALSGGAGFRWPIKHFNAYGHDFLYDKRLAAG